MTKGFNGKKAGGAAGGPITQAALPREAGRAKRGLDLSLGHIGTIETGKPLKPVERREDCFDWVTLDEIQTEIFAAFNGAVAHARHHDFEADALEGGTSLLPGTIVSSHSNDPWHDRAGFLQVLLTGIVWRLEALAAERGAIVDGASSAGLYDREFTPPRGMTARQALDDQTWLGKYLGGVVSVITDADIKAMPPRYQRALRASIARGGKAVKVEQ